MNSIVFIKGLPSSSVSPSDIWEVEFNGHTCIMKIFVYSVEGKVPESAEFFLNEINIYTIVSSQLNNASRFVLPLESSGVNKTFQEMYTPVGHHATLLTLCRNILYMFNRTDFSLIYGNHDRYAIDDDSDADESIFGKVSILQRLDYFRKNLRFGYMITKKIVGSTLSVETQNRPSELVAQQCPLLALFFFGVYALAEVGINQNDLHWNNVFVTKVEAPFMKNCLIFFNKHVYRIKYSRRPVIFDFDRGVVRGQHSAILERYSQYGNCPDFHMNRDITKDIQSWFRHVRQAPIPLPEITSTLALLSSFIFSKEIYCGLEKDKNIDVSLCDNDELDQIKGKDLVEWLLQSNFHAEYIKNFSGNVRRAFTADFREELLKSRLDRNKLVERAARNIYYDAGNKVTANNFLNELKVSLS